MPTQTRCDAESLVRQHLRDLYGELEERETNRILNAERRAVTAMNNRCNRRRLLKLAANEAFARPTA